MTHLQSSPKTQTNIRLDARKSFSLGLWIKDSLAHTLDIEGVTLRMVVRKSFVTKDPNDSLNLILSSTAFIADAGQGYARFDIQATELDHAPGEYQYAIVLISNGYSSVIVEGVMEIMPNVEFSSVNEYFIGMTNPPKSIDVILRQNAAVTVYAGQALAPGTLSFTNSDKKNLDDLATQGWNALANKPDLGSAAFVNVEDVALPPGGSPGAALIKRSASDFDTHWAQVATGGTGLSAVGQPSGAVPTATGSDTWDWAQPQSAVSSVNGQGGAVLLDADDIEPSPTRLYLTTAQGQILAAFSNPPTYTDLADLPTLGTAAAKNVGDFLATGTRVVSLAGISRGTAAPSGGSDGDLYRQYS